MSLRNVFTIALSMFVAASLVVLTVKNLRPVSPQGHIGRGPEHAGAVAGHGRGRPDRLIAYYFHGQTRCATCRTIESYAHEAVATGFAGQLQDGRIEWKVVDYEQPQNSHFAQEFDLIAPTVLLVQIKDGRQQQWKDLSQVWDFVDDKQAFVAFVRREVRGLCTNQGTP